MAWRRPEATPREPAGCVAAGYVLVSMSRDAMHIDYFGVDSDEALFSVALPPAPNPKGPAMP